MLKEVAQLGRVRALHRWLVCVQASGSRAQSAHSTCSRLSLTAKHTRHHSPAAAVKPRRENWRKPSTALMRPSTGSTVHVRQRYRAWPSSVGSLEAIWTSGLASSGGGASGCAPSADQG